MSCHGRRNVLFQGPGAEVCMGHSLGHQVGSLQGHGHGNVTPQNQEGGNSAGKGSPETQRLQEQLCVLGFCLLILLRCCSGTSPSPQCRQDLSCVSPAGWEMGAPSAERGSGTTFLILAMQSVTESTQLSLQGSRSKHSSPKSQTSSQ